MLTSSRSYKLLTRIVVLVVFMASVLPGIAHACMMAHAHDGVLIKKCCCAKSEHVKHHRDDHDHGGMDHGGMDHSGMDHSGMDHSGMDHSGMDHSGMDIKDKKCDHHDSSKDPHDDTLDEDCCQTSLESSSFDVIMSRANKITQEELLVSSLILLHAQPFLNLPAVQTTHGSLEDTRPPTSPSLPLHILYARFLN